MKIAVSLSGGGFRATAFHLGVLARLAAERMLSCITLVSSVSGGSLAAGLVLSLSGMRWPADEEYLGQTLPEAGKLLMSVDLEWEILKQMLTRPWLLPQGRAKLLALGLIQKWQIQSSLADLPKTPISFINATTYETGRNFRFGRSRMGDYKANYVLNPNFLLADALAASSAYPGLLGPLTLNTGNFQWVKYKEWKKITAIPCNPLCKKLHLWDGGIYDNLGIESLFKPGGFEYQDECDFLIVSDASCKFEFERPTLSFKRAYRLVGISMDQIRSLRARMVVSYFEQCPDSGSYIRMGNSTEYLCSALKVDSDTRNTLSKVALSGDEVTKAVSYGTNLARMRADDFGLIARHGWECADLTLALNCPDIFKHIPYDYSVLGGH